MTTAELKAEVKRHERDRERLDRLHRAALQARDLGKMEELDALRGRSLDLATMARGYLFKRETQFA
jgi:hypothetical protein